MEKTRSQSRQRPAVAGARLTAAEYDKLRAIATQEGKSVSGFVRSLVLERMGTRTA